MSVPELRVLTPQQKEECARYWRERYELVQGKVHSSILEQLAWFGVASAFGYGQGEIRDGELGKWDIYYFLTQEGMDLKYQNDVLLITGLSKAEINKAEREDADWNW